MATRSSFSRRRRRCRSSLRLPCPSSCRRRRRRRRRSLVAGILVVTAVVGSMRHADENVLTWRHPARRTAQVALPFDYATLLPLTNQAHKAQLALQLRHGQAKFDESSPRERRSNLPSIRCRSRISNGR